MVINVLSLCLEVVGLLRLILIRWCRWVMDLRLMLWYSMLVWLFLIWVSLLVMVMMMLFVLVLFSGSLIR